MTDPRSHLQDLNGSCVQQGHRAVLTCDYLQTCQGLCAQVCVTLCMCECVCVRVSVCLDVCAGVRVCVLCTHV